ncbi:hypothetical protein ACS0PU_008221 [Formica fusca]
MAEVRERRDFNTHTHTSMQNTVPRSFRPIVTLVDCSNESSHNAPSPAEGKPQNKLDNYLLIAPWVYESCHLGNRNTCVHPPKCRETFFARTILDKNANAHDGWMTIRRGHPSARERFLSTKRGEYRHFS